MGNMHNELLQVLYNPNGRSVAAFHQNIKVPLENGASRFRYIEFIATPSPDVDENIDFVGKEVEPGARVMIAGGDGSFLIGINGIIKAKKEVLSVGVWPTGNINDIAYNLNGSDRRTDPSIVDMANISDHVRDFYPMDLNINGEHAYYVMSYCSLGATGWFAKQFTDGEARNRLKHSRMNKLSSVLEAARLYLSGRFADTTLPPRTHQTADSTESTDTSDTVYLNGPRMAGYVYSGVDYGYTPDIMRMDIDMTTRKLVAAKTAARMLLSRLVPVRGMDQGRHQLVFDKPTDAWVQFDGEYRQYEGVREVSVEKSGVLIPVLSPVVRKRH